MTDVDSSTLEWVRKEITSHRTWRRLWSVSYFTGAAVTVIAGALATASAGFMEDYPSGPLITALLAGLATVFASLEKVLRLREKWDLHRNVQTTLEMINLRASAGLIDTETAVALIERAAHAYSMELADLNAPSADRLPDGASKGSPAGSPGGSGA